METQILEGTFTEVQRRLSALPLKPETQLRVVVSESNAPNVFKAEASIEGNFHNSLIMLPAPGLTTLEEVQKALYQAEMKDALGEEWEQVSQTLTGSASSNGVSLE